MSIESGGGSLPLSRDLPFQRTYHPPPSLPPSSERAEVERGGKTNARADLTGLIFTSIPFPLSRPADRDRKNWWGGLDGMGEVRKGRERKGELARSKYQLGDPKVGQFGRVVTCDLLCSCGCTFHGSFIR